MIRGVTKRLLKASTGLAPTHREKPKWVRQSEARNEFIKERLARGESVERPPVACASDEKTTSTAAGGAGMPKAAALPPPAAKDKKKKPKTLAEAKKQKGKKKGKEELTKI